MGEMAMPIFLASGNRMKRAMWDPRGSHADLEDLHKKGAPVRRGCNVFRALQLVSWCKRKRRNLEHQVGARDTLGG